jgi:ADP-ribosylglycohydrolase
MSLQKYAESIYAGVLGKLVGVYLGRPVEGWPYPEIRRRFDEVDYYVNELLGIPLVVADDDISGTFGFFRAVEDSGYARPLMAAQVGKAWLNYIVQDRTILWWGGLGRSTEHTAYFRLRAGVEAPASGSIALNGPTIAEQIGAQIFMDAFAMMSPGDPDQAVYNVRQAASVSHDGLALEAACYLGAMEAMAFEQRDLEQLLDAGLRFVRDPRLLHLVEDVRSICASSMDWHSVRAIIDDRYGYDKYPGPCHNVPNHAMVLAALLLGGDHFQRAVTIAASAGFDTDCNAGNVGCLNGIRLGLDALTSGADFRAPVADRMYVVTADGGSCVTDAVQQTRRILAAASAYRNEPIALCPARFGFDFRGSTQGFTLLQAGPCSFRLALSNLNQTTSENGLLIEYRGLAPGISDSISTPVFLDFAELAQNFATVASPTLYPTQTVVAHLRAFADDNPTLRFFVLYYDAHDQVARCDGEALRLRHGDNEVRWTLPPLDGMPIFRFGIEFLAPNRQAGRYDGRIALLDLDWTGAPQALVQTGMLMTSIWNLSPRWLQAWVNSAKHFAPDFKYTYCISHPEEGGAVTIGTRDWYDYAVRSRLAFSLHQAGGLVLRSQGHRRYYAAQFSGGKLVSIVRRIDDEQQTLASVPFAYAEDQLYDVRFCAHGAELVLEVEGVPLLQAADANAVLTCGGAGFCIDAGTMLADGFSVHRA